MSSTSARRDSLPGFVLINSWISGIYILSWFATAELWHHLQIMIAQAHFTWYDPKAVPHRLQSLTSAGSVWSICNAMSVWPCLMASSIRRRPLGGLVSSLTISLVLTRVFQNNFWPPGTLQPAALSFSAVLQAKGIQLAYCAVAVLRRQPLMTVCLLVHTSRKYVRIQAMKALSAARNALARGCCQKKHAK